MIENFINHLPEKIRSTDDFEYGTKFRKKSNALKHRYVEVNQLYKKYIALDLDKPGSAYWWEERSLPPPTIIAVNPGILNPKAIWEIKEYYYTTTFGSRVADGVYETLLDGLELQELQDNEGIHVKHYLFVDAYKTWWEDGRSYLCRMIDMIHMGLVDEVIFGKEAVQRIPEIVKDWR